MRIKPVGRLSSLQQLKVSESSSAMSIPESHPDALTQSAGLFSRWPYCASFNGATAFQPWIPSTPWERLGARRRGFNGATAFQPWILLLGVLRVDPHRGDELQWGHGLSAVDTPHQRHGGQ